MHKTKVPVGIFMDKGLKKLDKILLPIYTKEDLELLPYIQKFIHNSQSQVTLIDMHHILQEDKKASEMVRAIALKAPNHISKFEAMDIDAQLFKDHDLLLISAESWRELIESNKIWQSEMTSVLVIKK